MTKFKWINRWITADLSGIHIMAAVLCVFLYGAGYLIPSSRLMTAGYAGLFLTILFFLLHLQLHACDNFLSMHPSTDHIPKSQMKLVNGVYMAVFLAAAGCFLWRCSPYSRADWLIHGIQSVLTTSSVSGPFSSGSSKRAGGIHACREFYSARVGRGGCGSLSFCKNSGMRLSPSSPS